MADSRDILTLPEAKRILRIHEDDTLEDDVLAVYITAASRLLDQHAGHTVAYTSTSERHDGTNNSGRGYRSKITLHHRPVLTVTTVVEHRNGNPLTLAAETSTSQPSDSYLVDRYDPDPILFNGVVRRRGSGEDARWEYGRQNIAVTYTAGRVQTTTQVDARFKRACGIVLENLWRDREPGLEAQGEFDVPHQSFPTFALPRAAAQLLSEEMGQAKLWGIA